jgi:hypothetical protein
MNSGRKWMFIGICLVFIAGLFAGIVVERKFLNCRPGLKGETREKRSKQEPLDRMTKDLSLDKEQREAVKKIFEEHKPEFEALHKQVRDNLSKLLGEMDKEILNVLNNEQKKKYEIFVKERKKHHLEDGPRGDKDHDRPPADR